MNPAGFDNKPKRVMVGWREYVELPDLGVPRIKAKVDTGARTSALNARDVEIEKVNGVTIARFTVPIASISRVIRGTAPFVGERLIKNTSGVPENRAIIRTLIRLGTEVWPIEVSLAERDNMAFDLILGRTAIRRHRLLVDPGRSFLLGGAKRATQSAPPRP